MKTIGFILCAASVSCTSTGRVVDQARENVVDNTAIIAFEENGLRGEVHCGLASVCEDIRVSHVQRSAEGDVTVTLQNNTAGDVVVQVALESMQANGVRTDRTTFHTVALAPRQDGLLSIGLLGSLDDTLIIMLRDRRAEG
jgi:hypothetical protein